MWNQWNEGIIILSGKHQLLVHFRKNNVRENSIVNFTQFPGFLLQIWIVLLLLWFEKKQFQEFEYLTQVKQLFDAMPSL